MDKLEYNILSVNSDDDQTIEDNFWLIRDLQIAISHIPVSEQYIFIEEN